MIHGKNYGNPYAVVIVTMATTYVAEERNRLYIVGRRKARFI